jgi:hypothetical protein
LTGRQSPPASIVFPPLIGSLQTLHSLQGIENGHCNLSSNDNLQILFLHQELLRFGSTARYRAQCRNSVFPYLNPTF